MGAGPVDRHGVLRHHRAVENVSGGYAVHGKWRFCSGIDHANWVIINARSASEPASILLAVTLSDLQVADGWHVLGMVATGSKDIVADELFVLNEFVSTWPESFGARADGNSGNEHYLASVPLAPYATSWVIGPVLGCAEGVLSEITGCCLRGACVQQAT